MNESDLMKAKKRAIEVANIAMRRIAEYNKIAKKEERIVIQTDCDGLQIVPAMVGRKLDVWFE